MIIDKRKIGDFQNWRFRIADDAEMGQLNEIHVNMPWKSKVIFHRLDKGTYRVDFMVERHAEWYSQVWEIENDRIKEFSKSGLSSDDIWTETIEWQKGTLGDMMVEYIFNETWPDKRILR